MWILHFIPDSFLLWVINIICLVGLVTTVVGFLSGFISRLISKWKPGLIPYQLIIQVSGIALLVVGAYFKGGFGVEEEWRAKAAELQAKIDAAAVQSQQVNTQIQTKIVTKIKTIHDTKVVTHQVIKEVATTIDKECTVAPEAITILNAAARGEKPKLDLSIPADALKTPEGTK
jgi:hypothetical protein